jgi:hypothetical protein
MNNHTCIFSSYTGKQYLTFGELRCDCGRVMPYQKPATDAYRLWRLYEDKQPGSAAANYFFFRLPIPPEVMR